MKRFMIVLVACGCLGIASQVTAQGSISDFQSSDKQFWQQRDQEQRYDQFIQQEQQRQFDQQRRYEEQMNDRRQRNEDAFRPYRNQRNWR